MPATIRNITAARRSIDPFRDRHARNRKIAMVLLGVMAFLMMVSVVTILVKN